MQINSSKGDVGVIIARFQVPKLHEAHKELIQFVCDKHSKVLIILGLSPLKTSLANPLDIEMRKQLISKDFPEVLVSYVKDVPDDSIWSEKLDEIILDHLTPNQTAVLYGSRDSFIPFYSGNFPVVELAPSRMISGSEIRAAISKRVMSSEEFRSGVIWATGNQYPANYATVDVAIIDRNKNELLLGRKQNERLYRFIGGFSSPESESYENDAKREAYEETGLEVDNIKYLFSLKVNDWRYKKETNKIKTLFFVADYIFGSPKANDDIIEVKFFKINELNESYFVDTHKPLWNKFANYLNK